MSWPRAGANHGSRNLSRECVAGLDDEALARGLQWDAVNRLDAHAHAQECLELTSKFHGELGRELAGRNDAQRQRIRRRLDRLVLPDVRNDSDDERQELS